MARHIGFIILKPDDELPVCEHCGSVLAHPCDCQLYLEDQE